MKKLTERLLIILVIWIRLVVAILRIAVAILGTAIALILIFNEKRFDNWCKRIETFIR